MVFHIIDHGWNCNLISELTLLPCIGDAPMHKIKFNARSEYEYINNFKVLTGTTYVLQICHMFRPFFSDLSLRLVYFAQKNIDRPINIEKLVKCKMQDNLEFLQWAKKFWDQNYPGGDYDALARRKGQPV
jgi:RP/EB family microtubule-associated protein